MLLVLTESELEGDANDDPFVLNNNDFVKRVKRIIADNLDDEQFNVGQLASAMYLSVSQLNRRLNKEINSSAGKLIRDARLNEALKHLGRSNKNPIAEIAFLVGYTNVTSFCRAFKRKFGCAPSQYTMS